MRARPHHHPCAHCQVQAECCGDIEQNYDGIPEWICREFESPHGSDFICDACAEKKEQHECEECGAWGDEPHDATCGEFQGVPV